MRLNFLSVGITAQSPMENAWKLRLNKPKESGLLIGNAFEGVGWPANLICLKSDTETPDGAESEHVKKRRKKKAATRNTDRLTLAPLKFEDALRAMLQTQPPPSSKKAKA